MSLYKTLQKNIAMGLLIEGIDLIFRIVCQISGQDNVSYKSKNYFG